MHEPIDYLFNTTADEEAKEHRAKALVAIKELREWLDAMEGALKRDDSNSPGHPAFPIAWGTDMMQKSLAVFNHLSMCNGACMVRGKAPK